MMILIALAVSVAPAAVSDEERRRRACPDVDEVLMNDDSQVHDDGDAPNDGIARQTSVRRQRAAPQAALAATARNGNNSQMTTRTSGGEFERALKRLKERGYSLTELEQLLGLSTGYLSKLKARRATPSYQLTALVSLMDAEPVAARHLNQLQERHAPKRKRDVSARRPTKLGRERRALETLLTVSEQLKARGIPWALGGAVALEAFGIIRPTADVDVFVADEARSILSVFRDAGVAVGHFNEEHAAAFPADASAGDRIDIHFAKFRFLRDGIARRVERDLAGNVVPVLPPLTLFIMKMMSPRDVERDDALKLLDAGLVKRSDARRTLAQLTREPAPRDPWSRLHINPELALRRLKEQT